MVYLIKLNVKSDIVYYSQETNIQLLWHIWLCEYESIVAKLWLRPNLTHYQLKILIFLACFMFFQLVLIHCTCFGKISISCPVLI